MMNWFSVPNPKPTRKADIIRTIEGRLTSIRHLHQLWGDLSEIEQLAVREVLYSPKGIHIPNQFNAKYRSLPAVNVKNFRKSTLPVGFFLYQSGRYVDSELTIPEDLRQSLLKFVPPPPATTLSSEKELPKSITRGSKTYTFEGETAETEKAQLVRRDMERAASKDLLSVLRLIDMGRISASAKTRRPSAVSVKRVAEELYGGDFFEPEVKEDRWDQVVGPIRAFAWPLLVQAGKLVQLRGSKLTLTKAGYAALGAPAAKTLRRLWQQWVKNRMLDEFSRIDVIKGQTRGKGRRAMTAAPGRRKVIAEALESCPVGEWVRFDEFSRFMEAAGFEFSVTRDPWRLYAVDSQYGTLGYSSNEWGILQGRYLLCLLFEYISTLGMIDIVYIHPSYAKYDYGDLWAAESLSWISQYDGLEYFRLNPLGAYCLGIAEDYEPSLPSDLTPLTVFPDLRVCSEHPLSTDERLTLETFANTESEGVWRLVLDKTLTAVASGNDVDSLRKFLAARDYGQPLPEKVEGFLRNVERNASALKVLGSAILIECADEKIAAKLVTNKQTSKLCLPAGKKHLAVRIESEKAFRRAVLNLGYGISQP